MAIVVVREFDEFSRLLAKAGFSVINCRTIKTAPHDNLAEFDQKLCRLSDYDGVFLTSRCSSAIFRERYRRAARPFLGKVFVFGQRGFDLLKSEELELYLDGSAGTIAGMLDRIPRPLLAGKRFLVVRGERSLATVTDFLKPIARVEEMAVYRTVPYRISVATATEIRMRVEKRGVDFFCFFSPSGVESFVQQLGWALLEAAKIATIGETTADYFRHRGVNVDVVAPLPTAKDFVHELISHARSAASIRT